MDINTFIKSKWQTWKAKTFTKENFKRFLLVQAIDIAFILCFVFGAAGIIPFTVFVIFAILYVFLIIFKKVKHAAETIKNMKENYKEKARK